MVDRTLAIAGIPDEKRKQIYKVLAAVLHIGNVVIEENVKSGKCQISEPSRIHFEHAAHILNIEQQFLETTLLTHTIEVNGSEQIMSVRTRKKIEINSNCKMSKIINLYSFSHSMDLNLSKAKTAMASLSKILYERVFRDLVFLINSSSTSSTQLHTKLQIKMLDIAGFGSFVHELY